MGGLPDPHGPKGDGATFVRIGEIPKKGLSGGGLPSSNTESGMFKGPELDPKEEGPGGIRARGEPLTRPVLKGKSGMVSSASGDDSTSKGGLTLDPINPLGALPGSDPPNAGAPRAKGEVLGESTISIGSTEKEEAKEGG
jgi:hypothetical protein